MELIKRIKNLLFPELPEFQRLELEYKRLCQKRHRLKRQGYVTDMVEAELDRVSERMRQIVRQQNEESHRDRQYLQEAYAELDAEFPNLRNWIERDR